MAKTISSLNIALGATTSPFVSAFRGATSTLTGFSSAASSAGESLARLTGIGAALDLGKKALDSLVAAPGEAIAAAERQIQAETKLAAVLKATGGAAGFTAEQLKEHAAALQASTTFGDEAIIEMQSVLATFRNISGDTFTKATELALDMSSVLGTDLQSSAIQLGKALNDPVQGLTSLRRVGVSFTAQQTAQIKSLQQSGDLLGAQKIILNQLAQSFGGAAQALASTPFGKLKQLGNLFGDLKEKIGTGLARALAGIANSFHLDALIESAGAAVQKMVDRLAPIGSAILSTIIPPIQAAADFIITAAETVGAFITAHSSIVIAAIEGIGIALAAITIPVALGALVSALGAIAGIVASPIALIVALGAAIGVMITQTIGWSAAWAYVTSAAQAVYGVLAAVWSAIYGVVAPVVQAIWQVIVNNWVSILDTTVGVFQSVWNVVSAVSMALWTALTTIWGGITAAWGAAMNFLGLSTSNAATTIGSIAQTVVAWFKWLADDVTLAMNIAAYAISHWRDTALLIGTEAIYQVVKLGNQIQYVFTEVIPSVLTWFANNWQDIFTTIWNFTSTLFSNLASNIVNVIKNIPGLIKGTVNFSDLWTPLTDGFESTIKEMPKIPERVAGPLEDALKKDRDSLRDSYSQGLGDFLSKQGSTAGEAMQKAFAGTKPQLNLPKVETPKMDTSQITAPAISATNAIGGIGAAAMKAQTELKLLTTGSAEAQLAKYAAMWDGLTQTIVDAQQQQASSALAPSPVAEATPAPVPTNAVNDMRDASGESVVSLMKQQLQATQQGNRYLGNIANEPDDEVLDL